MPNLTGIFDSHAHYDARQFDADRDALLAALPKEGVVGVVNCGTDIATSEFSLKLARRYPYIRAAMGIHPHECADMADADLAEIERLAGAPEAVAIGEIGLDYYYDFAPRDKQRRAFASQLELANKLKLPVIVHDREAHADTLALLREHRPAGVVHCFSGSVEMLQGVLALDMYIGLDGPVTFKNAKTPQAVAAAVPIERLLLETDAPYLAPEPYRGKRGDSRMIAHIARKIAEIKGMEAQELLDICAANARRAFSLGSC